MVATVTCLKAAATTVHYFEVDGYYAKNDPEHRKASRRHGGATALPGLRGPVKPNRFESVPAGYVPGTDVRLGRLRDGEHQYRARVQADGMAAATFRHRDGVAVPRHVHSDENLAIVDHGSPSRLEALLTEKPSLRSASVGRTAPAPAGPEGHTVSLDVPVSCARGTRDALRAVPALSAG